MSIQSGRAGIRERVSDNGTTTCPTGRAGSVLPVERETSTAIRDRLLL